MQRIVVKALIFMVWSGTKISSNYLGLKVIGGIASASLVLVLQILIVGGITSAKVYLIFEALNKPFHLLVL